MNEKNFIKYLQTKNIPDPDFLIRTGNTKPCTKPQDHGHILGHYHEAGPEEIQMAIDSSLEAWKTWSNTSLEERAQIL